MNNMAATRYAVASPSVLTNVCLFFLGALGVAIQLYNQILGHMSDWSNAEQETFFFLGWTWNLMIKPVRDIFQDMRNHPQKDKNCVFNFNLHPNNSEQSVMRYFILDSLRDIQSHIFVVTINDRLPVFITVTQLPPQRSLAPFHHITHDKVTLQIIIPQHIDRNTMWRTRGGKSYSLHK